MTAIPPLRRRQAAPRLPLAPPPVQPASQPVDLFFNSNRPGPAPINTDLSGLSDMTRALGGLSQHLAFKQGREEAIQEKANADAEAVEDALSRPGLDRQFIGPPEALGEESLIPRAAVVDEWEQDVSQGSPNYPVSEGGVLIGSEGMQDPRSEEHRTVRNKVAKATRERVVEFAYSPTGQQAINETGAMIRADDDGRALMQFHVRAATFDPEKGGGLGGPDISADQVVRGVLAARKKVAPWLNKGDARHNALARAAYLDRFYAYAKRFRDKVERDYAQSVEIYYKTVGGPRRVRAALYSAMDQLGEAPLVALQPGTQGPQQQTLQVVQDRMTHNFQVALSNMVEGMARHSGMPPSVGPGGLPLGANEISIGWMDDALRAKQQELIREEREDEFPEWAEEALNVLDGVNIGNTKAIDHATYQALLAKWTPTVMGTGGRGIGNANQARLNRLTRKRIGEFSQPYLDLALKAKTADERQAIFAGAEPALRQLLSTQSFWEDSRVKLSDRGEITSMILDDFRRVGASVGQVDQVAQLRLVKSLNRLSSTDPELAEQRFNIAVANGQIDIATPGYRGLEDTLDARRQAEDFMGDGSPWATGVQGLTDIEGEIKDLKVSKAPLGVVRSTKEALAEDRLALHQGYVTEALRLRAEHGGDEGKITAGLRDWMGKNKGPLLANSSRMIEQFRTRQDEVRAEFSRARTRGMNRIDLAPDATTGIGPPAQVLTREELEQQRGVLAEANSDSELIARVAREQAEAESRVQSIIDSAVRIDPDLAARKKEADLAGRFGEGALERRMMRERTAALARRMRKARTAVQTLGKDNPTEFLSQELEDWVTGVEEALLGERAKPYRDARETGRPITEFADQFEDNVEIQSEANTLTNKLRDAAPEDLRLVYQSNPRDTGQVGVPSVYQVPMSLRTLYGSRFAADNEASFQRLFRVREGGGARPRPFIERVPFGVPATREEFESQKPPKGHPNFVRRVPPQRERIEHDLVTTGTKLQANLKVADTVKPQALYDIQRFSASHIDYRDVIARRIRMHSGESVDPRDVQDLAPYSTRFFATQEELEDLINDRESFKFLLSELRDVPHDFSPRPDGEFQIPITAPEGDRQQRDLARWITLQQHMIRHGGQWKRPLHPQDK